MKLSRKKFMVQSIARTVVAGLFKDTVSTAEMHGEMERMSKAASFGVPYLFRQGGLRKTTQTVAPTENGRKHRLHKSKVLDAVRSVFGRFHFFYSLCYI